MKLKLTAMVAGLTALLSLSGGPAYAEDPSIALIQSLVPELLEETSYSNQLEVTPRFQSVDVDSSSSTNQLIADLPTVSIQGTTGSVRQEQGLVVIRDDEANTSSVIQPTSSGGRILTVIDGPESAHCAEFTFDVPKGTSLERAAEGFYLEHGSDVLLHIAEAWALDSDGKAVPTNFTWTGRTLTQCVSGDSGALSYPLLADPGWDYTYQFNLNKSAATNKIHLKSCFNCYFPVDGAPQAFPAPNQLLPLTSTWLLLQFNMECRFNSEFNGTNSFGFSFLATANHVDGIGSWILFDLKPVSGVNKLMVSAHVMNDALQISPYTSGAKSKWQEFASNLNK